MAYCPGCGTQIADYTSNRCSSCGADLRRGPRSIDHVDEGLSGEEKVGICLGNICLSPLLGTILYFVWKDDKPKKADDVCTLTVYGFIGGIVLSFLFALLQAR